MASNSQAPTGNPSEAMGKAEARSRGRGGGGGGGGASGNPGYQLLASTPTPPPCLGLFTFSISIKRSYCLAFGFGIFRKIFVGGLPRDTTDGTSIGSFVLCFVAFDACADSRGLEDEIAIPFIQLKFFSLSLWSGRWSGWGVVDGMLFTFFFTALLWMYCASSYFVSCMKIYSGGLCSVWILVCALACN